MPNIDPYQIGLSLHLDFLTPEEEQAIIPFIAPNGKGAIVKSRANSKERSSVQRFGSKVPYNSFVVSESIPAHFDYMFDRMLDLGLLAERPNSVSINQYKRGDIIPPHIDSKQSGEVITVLSLLSDATMTFEKKLHKFQFHLPPRSVVQLRGEIRNEWKHSIEPVRDLRYSIVFRKG